MGIIQNTDCQTLPELFMKLLAQCVVTAPNNGFYALNVVVESSRDCDCVPLIDCDKNHLDPDAILRHIFTTDACGNLAIRLVNCDGTFVFGEQNPQ